MIVLKTYQFNPVVDLKEIIPYLPNDIIQ